jgi:hypothetical protein
LVGAHAPPPSERAELSSPAPWFRKSRGNYAGALELARRPLAADLLRAGAHREIGGSRAAQGLTLQQQFEKRRISRASRRRARRQMRPRARRGPPSAASARTAPVEPPLSGALLSARAVN